MRSRTKILQATLGLIADVGFGGVTIVGAAQAAGVSRQTVYSIFGTREELVSQAISGQLLEAYAEMTSRLEQIEDPGEYVVETIVLGRTVVREHPVLAVLLGGWRREPGVRRPRVATMLGLATAPDELVASPNYAAARIFADRVRAAGMPLDKIPMPIDWNFALAELRGDMASAYTNGAGALGVNNGGKHTVDVTYLAEAEATGLSTVEVMHDVTDIERATDGRWTVYVDRTDESGTVLENKILTTGALVLAAGSLASARRRRHGQRLRPRRPRARAARPACARRGADARQRRRIQPVDDDRRRRRTRPRQPRRAGRRHDHLTHRRGG